MMLNVAYIAALYAEREMNDRQAYDLKYGFRFMEEADLDWRAPRSRRPMVEGDL